MQEKLRPRSRQLPRPSFWLVVIGLGVAAAILQKVSTDLASLCVLILLVLLAWKLAAFFFRISAVILKIVIVFLLLGYVIFKLGGF